jgi:hypothetical protein
MRQIKVLAHYDDEAGVWYAESDDVTGLIWEAATFDQLVVDLTDLVPELLELNHENGTAAQLTVIGERGNPVARIRNKLHK